MEEALDSVCKSTRVHSSVRAPAAARAGKVFAMALTHDPDIWEKRLAALPLASYGAGETVFAEGTKTGRLMILKSGAVSIVKYGHEIARITEPGAVFGELSALLDQPHSADVRALERCEFHVADAATLLGQDPAALLYITMVLARRLDAANHAFVQLKAQIDAGEPAGLIDATLDQIEGLLSAVGTGFIRAGAGIAGYPFA
jgi:CRP/FNR family transcriptional regulator, cyclic AMP receptor protein